MKLKRPGVKVGQRNDVLHIFQGSRKHSKCGGKVIGKFLCASHLEQVEAFGRRGWQDAGVDTNGIAVGIPPLQLCRVFTIWTLYKTSIRTESALSICFEFEVKNIKILKHPSTKGVL